MNIEDNFTYHLAESGRFQPRIDTQAALVPIILSNPGNTVEFEITSRPHAAWVDSKSDLEASKPKNQLWAQMEDFIAYGKAIVDIAHHLAIHQP